MASIISSYKKILASGCSHSSYADPVALDAVLEFKRHFKPDINIHLGDAWDAKAFRSGAVGTKDETDDIDTDLQHGFNWLERLRPTHFRLGNHDWRAWLLMDHPNAKVAKAARAVVAEIEAKVKKLHCKMYPYLGVWDTTDPKSILKIGGYHWIHGVFYNENAIRDHAERFGPCVLAHLHSAGMAFGRRDDNPAAYCVGTLSKIHAMEYAARRAATLRWSQGFVWGYVPSNPRRRAQLYVHVQQPGEGEWLLP